MRTFSSRTSNAWTVTTQGSLHPDVPRHYIRINPNTDGREDPNTGTVTLANQPPEGPFDYPAKDIVDAGFLELVRYGIRDAHDPIVVESLKVVDAVLRSRPAARTRRGGGTITMDTGNASTGRHSRDRVHGASVAAPDRRTRPL